MSFFMAQAQPAPISLASQHVYMAFSLELAALAPAEDLYLNSVILQESFASGPQASGITSIKLTLSVNKENRTTFAMLISVSR